MIEDQNQQLATNNNYAFTCIFFQGIIKHKLLMGVIENCSECGRVLIYFAELKL